MTSYHFWQHSGITNEDIISSIHARCQNISAYAGVILADPQAARYVVKIRYGKYGFWVFVNQDGKEITCKSRRQAIALAVDAGYTQVEQFITPDGRVWIC